MQSAVPESPRAELASWSSRGTDEGLSLGSCANRSCTRRPSNRSPSSDHSLCSGTLGALLGIKVQSFLPWSEARCMGARESCCRSGVAGLEVDRRRVVSQAVWRVCSERRRVVEGRRKGDFMSAHLPTGRTKLSERGKQQTHYAPTHAQERGRHLGERAALAGGQLGGCSAGVVLVSYKSAFADWMQRSFVVRGFSWVLC